MRVWLSLRRGRAVFNLTISGCFRISVAVVLQLDMFLTAMTRTVNHSYAMEVRAERPKLLANSMVNTTLIQNSKLIMV